VTVEAGRASRTLKMAAEMDDLLALATIEESDRY